VDSAPETKRWLLCPVCHQVNPEGTQYCRHCWGAALRLVRPMSSQEVERALSRLKRRRIIKVITISLVSLITFVSVVYASLYYFTDVVFGPPQGLSSDPPPGDWAMFRRDLSHSGAAESGDTLPQGTLKWVFSTDAPIHSSPAVVDGIVYVGSRDFKLYAVDAATGAKRWEYKTGSWVESSPVIVNGVVYFGSNDGRLYALDAHSGEKLWDFKVKYSIKSSPAVADGTVYFGGGDYHVYALDAITGEKIWDFDTGGRVDSSLAVDNGIVYVGSVGKFFYALNAADGRLRLSLKSIYPIYSSPAVSGETVYFINFRGALYAVDGNARIWLWEHAIRPYWIQLWAMGLPLPQPPPRSGYLWGLLLDEPSISSPTLAGDILYAGSGNKLVAVDLQSHQKCWEFEAEGVISSSPALVDDTIYVGSEDGRLYAVDTTAGEKLWDILTGGKITSSPAVADGTVYISSHDGNLYAIE